jgi:hypothetical protein
MLSILVETKNEYISHLINILTPLIFEGLQSIYKEAQKTSDATDVLKIFQTYLKRIPKWNQNLIDQETERIINSSHSYGWLGDLIKATLKSSLIVLMYNPTKKIQEKVDPSFYKNISTSDFIHKVYIECAREIWNNPYLLYHNYLPIEIKRNQRDCMNIIKDCIREALRKLLPVKHILSIYLGEDIEEDANDNQFEKSITEAEKKNLTKIIKKDLSSNKELEYNIFDRKMPKPESESKSDSRTIGSKILNIIKPYESITSIKSKNDKDEKYDDKDDDNYDDDDSTSSNNSVISNKEKPDALSITGSLNNDTSELYNEPQISIKESKMDDNLDIKIKKILNNDLIETDFDTTLTELNGKYQEMFSNSDNKVKETQKTEKLFKKFMDF